MKKLLMLAAVAAMAVGAQAADPTTYGYTWTIDINNISTDYQLPNDLQAQLFDSDNKLLAQLTVGMFGADYNLNVNSANSYAQAAGLNTDYSIGELQMNGDDTHMGKLAVHMTATFKTTDNLYMSYSPQADPTPTKSLRVVLGGTDVASGEWRTQTLGVGWTGQAGTRSFGAAAEYAPVPEPTSGLLMLLGVAGLALKRKRV